MIDFTNDPYGIKAVLIALVLVGILMFVWDFIGLDSGSGGSPYGDPDSYYSE